MVVQVELAIRPIALLVLVLVMMLPIVLLVLVVFALVLVFWCWFLVVQNRVHACLFVLLFSAVQFFFVCTRSFSVLLTLLGFVVGIMEEGRRPYVMTNPHLFSIIQTRALSLTHFPLPYVRTGICISVTQTRVFVLVIIALLYS